ncbi:DUF4114 domain-containing protein [Sediminibacterium sp.]|uniref:DUF4114 domain-containing protein n=1 Tax=Sediminibacterium sp. TaxID=1917865 RepID=UPI003F71A46D
MSRKNLFITIAIFIFAIIHQVQAQNYTYMGSYNSRGLPNYLLTPRDSISSNFRNSIEATLPEYRPVPVYNPLLISNNHVKTIGINCPSDIWISFIDEGASYLNTLGYYTYPKGNPPTVAPNNQDITIIFPNASKSGFGGSLIAGDKVFLGRFPANTEIGFVLISDGWDGSRVKNGNWKVYSNSEFNPERNDSLKQHTVIIRDPATNRLVVGFEDILRDRNDCDQDFNDLLFYATIEPITCAEKLDSIPIFSEDGGVSFSGNTGGLESQSLGNKIAKRTMAKIKQGKNGPVDYSTMEKLDLSNIQLTNMSTNSPLSLSDIMPDRIPEGSYTAYLSTPTDIPAITNAIEVRAVDFIENDTCKAVAFATKTLGKVYDHTKPICDRLKGATLIKMDQFKLRNLVFTRYELKQENGNIEYSMSFSVGKKVGRNSFSFQSNWLNADFIGEDTMYNYQIWGVAPYLCIDLALNILDKLEAMMPLESIAASKPLPNTYIRYGNRDGLNVNLLVENETNINNGYIELIEKYNELSPLNVKRTIPFTLNTKGKTMVSFPMNDTHESLISLFINGKLQDVVYMSDGSWDIDYDSSKTVIESYTISNDSARNFADTYPVFRDVTVKAKTDGYVSAYKLLRGAAAEQDLTAYKTMSFKAKGEGTTLLITLIKNSVKDFTKQPHYKLPLTKGLLDYNINLEDFVGEDELVKVKTNDLTTVVFTFENASKVQSTIDVAVADIFFSKKPKEFVENLNQQKIHIYPNPSKNGIFNASFRSDINGPLSIRIINAATGKVIYNKVFQAIKGDNIVPIQLSSKPGAGMYMIAIEGNGIKYTTNRIMLN